MENPWTNPGFWETQISAKSQGLKTSWPCFVKFVKFVAKGSKVVALTLGKANAEIPKFSKDKNKKVEKHTIWGSCPSSRKIICFWSIFWKLVGYTRRFMLVKHENRLPPCHVRPNPAKLRGNRFVQSMPCPRTPPDLPYSI